MNAMTDTANAAANATALERLVDFYETLTPHTLARIADVYAADAAFKDPFNEVAGHVAITAIFRHMFVQVDGPRFVVTTRVLQGDDAFLTWDFHFSPRRSARPPLCVRGATHLRFGPDSRVSGHRDYWDPAEELYEKLPLLGGLMRLLKRAASR
jgi:ketosteroid isomerase-like protein